MKKTSLLILVIAAATQLVGCSNNGGDNFDPNKIAVKQEGSGPPPMPKPTGNPPAPSNP